VKGSSNPLKEQARVKQRQPSGILERVCDKEMIGCKGLTVTKRDSLCEIYIDNGREGQCCQGELAAKNKRIISHRPPL
jgi:hypothetical protein